MTTRKRILGAVLASAAILLFARPAMAFDYQVRDLCLGFRQPGGISEITINVGQASNYYSATPGTVIPIPQFNAGQLAYAFPSIDGLKWSVSGNTQSNDEGDPSIPEDTLWVTRPRSNPQTRTSPWLRYRKVAQGQTGSRILSIGFNARTFGDSTPPSLYNSATAVVIPSGHRNSYGIFVGSGTAGGATANFQTTFQGNVESLTPMDFASGTAPSRADLYELRVDTLVVPKNPGTYLGYFEFRPDGSMVFVAEQDSVLPALDLGADVSLVEGNAGQTNAVFTVQLGAASTNEVTVHYTTQDGTATAGTDYQAVSGTLVFPANSTAPQTITVPVLGDTAVEPDETFRVILSSPTNAVLGRGQATGTIVNDDTAAPPSPVIGGVRIDQGQLTFSFDATAGATYSVRGTNAAGLSAPINTWPVIQGGLAGSGPVQFQDTSAPAAERFYSVQAE